MTTEELAYRHGVRLRRDNINEFQAKHQAQHYVLWVLEAFWKGYRGNG
jgi:hypothetical protein